MGRMGWSVCHSHSFVFLEANLHGVETSQAAGKKYPNPKDSEARYMKIATSLGWPGSQASMPSKAAPLSGQTDDVDLENLSDDDESRPNTQPVRSGKGGGGMGFFVSSLARDPTDDLVQMSENSVHAFAITGDLDKLQAAIAMGADINAKDDFVSVQSLSQYPVSSHMDSGLHPFASCV